ncbi:hypothetical protein [Legionella brunensis]|uniref:Uncharacterized protein n=1 Tax=Legionella brunensis TaxID=29422 RepID=A0A0W0SCV9_9GAMM|nr:hypothetical protein [Legionella brunensis]KTC81359.1 hypothetical protein Lbru_1879 [Legionella brunensis]
MIKTTIYSFCCSCLIANVAFAQDICQKALESIYEKDSDIIAVIKLNTHEKRLYSSTVEDSQDCQTYLPFLSVKDPDVIQSKDGLCMVLPAGELKPNLCGLRVTLCNTEKDCQTIDIHLKAESGRYVGAEPVYYEMTFPQR